MGETPETGVTATLIGTPHFNDPMGLGTYARPGVRSGVGWRGFVKSRPAKLSAIPHGPTNTVSLPGLRSARR